MTKLYFVRITFTPRILHPHALARSSGFEYLSLFICSNGKDSSFRLASLSSYFAIAIESYSVFRNGSAPHFTLDFGLSTSHLDM
jgi:hypothetical protein